MQWSVLGGNPASISSRIVSRWVTETCTRCAGVVLWTVSIGALFHLGCLSGALFQGENWALLLKPRSVAVSWKPSGTVPLSLGLYLLVFV